MVTPLHAPRPMRRHPISDTARCYSTLFLANLSFATLSYVTLQSTTLSHATLVGTHLSDADPSSQL